MAEKKESAEAAVRAIRRVTRKKDAAEETVRIVLEGLRGETSIARLVPAGRRPDWPVRPYRPRRGTFGWSKGFLEAGRWFVSTRVRQIGAPEGVEEDPSWE